MAESTSWKERLTRKGMGRVFRHRDFVIFSFMGWLANIGTWLQRVGIQWLTWELTHSYAWLGAIAFVDAVAIMAFLPIFGTVIDRGDRLRLAQLSQALSTALTCVLGALTLAGFITPIVLLVVMALHGLTEAFWTPVRLALPPSLVPREELAGAIGLTSILFNIAQIIGPAMAGLIIAAFVSSRAGTGVLFVLNGVCGLVYLWSLFAIRLSYDEPMARANAGFVADLKEGFLYAFSREGLGLFIVFMMSTHMFMRSFRELLAGYADGHFHQGAEGLAVLSAAVGAGALAGAVVVANFGGVKGMVRLTFLVLASGIVLQFGFSLSDAWWVVVACTAGLGVTLAISGAGSQVLVQSSIHSAMRGRVMSLWAQIQRGGPAIGAWIVGAIAAHADFQYVMAGTTALYTLIFLSVLPWLGFLARHMEAPPDETQAPHAHAEKGLA